MKESNQERNSEKDTPLGTQSNSNARRQSNDRVEQNQSTSSRPRKRNFNWLKHPDETNLTTWQTDFLKHDWDHSALGSIHSWKPWLTQLVLMAMADPTPTLIFIDDDQGNAHAVVYNEAICPLIGDKVMLDNLGLYSTGPLKTISSIQAYKGATLRLAIVKYGRG